MDPGLYWLTSDNTAREKQRETVGVGHRRGGIQKPQKELEESLTDRLAYVYALRTHSLTDKIVPSKANKAR